MGADAEIFCSETSPGDLCGVMWKEKGQVTECAPAFHTRAGCAGGRAGGIRTHGLFDPNEALYQAEPQPDYRRAD